MNTYNFLSYKFKGILKKEMESRNLSLRQMAEEIGDISIGTLSRLSRGGAPDVFTLGKICSWLKIPVNEFYTHDKADGGPKEKDDSGEKVYYVDKQYTHLIGHAYFYECSGCGKVLPSTERLSGKLSGSRTYFDYCATPDRPVTMKLVTNLKVKK